MYFSGEHHHQLDTKNRIRIPAKFKSAITEKLVFSKGVSPCIFVLPYSKYAERIDRLKNLPQMSAKVQKALSIYMGSFIELEEDNQGRFLLPASLLKYANIKKNIVTVGVDERLEIWSEENREALYEEMSFEEAMNVIDEVNV